MLLLPAASCGDPSPGGGWRRWRPAPPQHVCLLLQLASRLEDMRAAAGRQAPLRVRRSKKRRYRRPPGVAQLFIKDDRRAPFLHDPKLNSNNENPPQRKPKPQGSTSSFTSSSFSIGLHCQHTAPRAL